MKTFFRFSHKEITSLCLSPCLGFLALLVPEVFTNNMVHFNIPFTFFISSTYENLLFIPSICALLIIGAILGFIAPRIWWLYGFFAISIFPVVSIVEMLSKPSSHNLLPFEFIIYCIFIIPVNIGSFIANRIRKRKFN